MDINDLRAAITVVSFLTFIGVVLWAYSGRRKEGFDRAARSVFEERDDVHHGNAKR
ncbi:MAG: CcoQ/FixQ family Cbb3-type cytochrome c oxidase assembly chaperone [Burkholderiales bacterium]|jgi:cytochrome c oxidase cbb3-type subunit 4|nr:CcoQ/FixQ family Cbb3-type cytochrome c oxidase assembly chaperone [Burkholderiales bacterium]